MKAEQRTVVVCTAHGTVELTGEVYADIWAVTPTVFYRPETGEHETEADRWSVTHVPTGRAGTPEQGVGHGEATLLARMFAERCTGPEWQNEEVPQWALFAGKAVKDDWLRAVSAIHDAGFNLLLALEDLRDECEAHQGPELRDDETWGPLMKAADAAIAKAMGDR